MDQLTFGDPRTQYPKLTPPKQHQETPGLDAELTPKPDRGEESYRGTGRLKGRKALVTGGDSGIGAAVAIAFAREGADVAINYLPAEEKDADEIVKLIEAAGRTAVKLPGDITDADFCQQLVDGAVKGLGGLDILVNNAGHQIAVEGVEELSDEQVHETFETNVFAMIRIIRLAVPHLPAGATIINTASVTAYTPPEVLIDYSATKAAIVNLSKNLAQSLAEKGIRVNCVAPGPIWTPLQVQGGQPKEELPTFGEATYLKRAGHPVELAGAYVFLASPESSYVLGECIGVNGGHMVP